MSTHRTHPRHRRVSKRVRAATRRGLRLLLRGEATLDDVAPVIEGKRG